MRIHRRPLARLLPVLPLAVALGGCAGGCRPRCPTPCVANPCAPASAPIVASAVAVASPAPSQPIATAPVDADAALARLLEGNRRYVAGTSALPSQLAGRRGEVARTQKPFAVILGCADSRVSPEIVFDQGLGDLFVVRVAGNVADDDAVASIEYAAAKLGSRLVVVLGHERCGAVKAAVDGGALPGHLPGLVAKLAPAVKATEGETGDRLDAAIRRNVKDVVESLEQSAPVLAELVHEGRLKVVGARYDLDTGEVTLVE